jgi:hypothetical protein
MPEWEKQKIFLRTVFPASTICRRFKDQMVFKNKECMQSFKQRLVTIDEWAENVILLEEMRSQFNLKTESAAAELLTLA